MSKITILIQAHTGSKRFLRKVLSQIENRPMIWYVIKRVKHVPSAQQIILLTTTKKEDRVLLDIATSSGIIGFRGPAFDVLTRFYKCAVEYNADPIIRITGDCPLIDPKIIDEMIALYLSSDYDYLSNTLEPTFPDGLDVEIFSFKTLEKVFKKAKLKSEREHVTSYIRSHRDQFKVYNFSNKENLSELRWTVDEKEDIELVRKIYKKMRPRTIFYLKDILLIISKNPELALINKKFKRNEGYLKSLEKDKIVRK